MKRLVGTIKRTSTTFHRSNGASHSQDSLEDTIIKALTAFCDSGTMHNAGDEYLHLPTIVEAAESSPSAAKAAANRLHKYLSKPNSPHEQRQYNAIMLIRILADNPGPTFTRNIDSRFVSSLKILLRDGQDVSVQQILRETLEFLATTKAGDTNLTELNSMWSKEKDKFVKQFGIHPLQRPNQGMYPGYRQDFFSSDRRVKKLPTPEELAGRVSEAATSAKLLLQMVQSTPPSEFYQNDMLKEFANRCQRASRSMQAYMEATDPSPDEETMMTLIETNDKLSVSLSKYQRAQLNARKHLKATQPETQLDQAPQSNYRPVSPLGEPTVVRPSKPHVPILSIPRKALKKFHRDPARQEIATANTQAATTYPPPGDDLSPLDPAPPPSVMPHSHISGAPEQQSYQYRPGEFQVENPFADKFSTADDRSHDLYDNKDNNNSNHHSDIDDFRRDGQLHPAMQDRDFSAAEPIGVARTTTTTTGAAPGMSSTYYPGGHDTLFDSDFSLPPAHHSSNVSRM
ncbi:uncharacterized protein CIMG_03185 [Coccidioides immitis RS]|uniref:GAT domain-containing protein n=1 Tax=Coccidioides immitis (strain RS) TaxID=246410 RepID=J3KAT3_COCIM|nr:uncharacterized protein CIMG_03185 [Coccidioides immitis RS]EAS32161.3 hypothetical protein CIMG_03185 [Coccidioides immitis RS]TPX19335.1 hypothetical protein DIZ76_017124 [Coccidioides immitis]